MVSTGGGGGDEVRPLKIKVLNRGQYSALQPFEKEEIEIELMGASIVGEYYGAGCGEG